MQDDSLDVDLAKPGNYRHEKRDVEQGLERSLDTTACTGSSNGILETAIEPSEQKELPHRESSAGTVSYHLLAELEQSSARLTEYTHTLGDSEDSHATRLGHKKRTDCSGASQYLRVSSGQSRYGEQVATKTEQLPGARSSPVSLVVTDNDVLLGRGKAHTFHPGNRRMQLLSLLHRQSYDDADRDEKREITWAIMNFIKLENGRFLKHDKLHDKWIEVPDSVARAKVSHAIRDGRFRKTVEDIDRKELDRILPLLPEHIRQHGAAMCIDTKEETAHNLFGEEESVILQSVLLPSSPSSAPVPSPSSATRDVSLVIDATIENPPWKKTKYNSLPDSDH